MKIVDSSITYLVFSLYEKTYEGERRYEVGDKRESVLQSELSSSPHNGISLNHLCTCIIILCEHVVKRAVKYCIYIR